MFDTIWMDMFEFLVLFSPLKFLDCRYKQSSKILVEYFH